MTPNHQCVSNQKIQTACPYDRANRSTERAVFFALNGRTDRTIYCQDKGRFLAFSFAVSGFGTPFYIPIFLHRKTPLRAQIRCFSVTPHGKYPHMENPDVANPHEEKPHGENPAQINTK